MALTRYSTAAQVKANNNKIELELTLDSQIEDRIDQGDKYIKSKLANLVDFTIIDALVTVPNWLNCLSQYMAMDLCLSRVYGAKRDAAEVSDIVYWQDKFDELLKECLAGEIDFGTAATGTSTFEWDARRHVRPMLGTGTTPDAYKEDNYGEYVELEDLQDDREYDNTGDA